MSALSELTNLRESILKLRDEAQRSSEEAFKFHSHARAGEKAFRADILAEVAALIGSAIGHVKENEDSVYAMHIADDMDERERDEKPDQFPTFRSVTIKPRAVEYMLSGPADVSRTSDTFSMLGNGGWEFVSQIDLIDNGHGAKYCVFIREKRDGVA